MALAGGHSLQLVPVVGWQGNWTSYDIERLSPDNRRKAQDWQTRFAGAACGLAAAEAAAEELNACWRHLAAASSVEARPLGGRHLDMSCEVRPLTLMDLLIPPPEEPTEPVAKRIKAARRTHHTQRPWCECLLSGFLA